MIRLDDNSISITQTELDTLREFIRDALYEDWDQYTDRFICSDPIEAGMRRMNPPMYDMAEEMGKL